MHHPEWENRFGRIVNISSIGGKIYTPFGAWYHATKHALEGWSDSLRIETKPFGIDVVLVEPGGIKTPWGVIAAENLKSTSGKGAYAVKAMKTAENMIAMYTSGKNLSDQELLAKTIVRAATVAKHSYLIEEAKNSLKNSNLTVGEIAYELGYEYPQYFSRFFKSKTGMSPLEFRELN